MYTQIDTYTHTHAYIHTYTHMCTHAGTRTHAYTHANAYTHTSTHAHKHACTHTQHSMHARTRMRAHTHTHTLSAEVVDVSQVRFHLLCVLLKEGHLPEPVPRPLTRLREGSLTIITRKLTSHFTTHYSCNI